MINSKTKSCDGDSCDCEEKDEIFIPDVLDKELLDYNIIKIYGEITEDSSDLVTSTLLLLRARNAEVSDTIKSQFKWDNEEEEVALDKSVRSSAEIVISTFGGDVIEALAIYDLMGIVKRTCDLKTFGYGKVMSAGVLLLAAGTPGERSVTANCRLMIHSIAAGCDGKLGNIIRQVDEYKKLEEQYINALSDNCTLSKIKLRKLFKGDNHYISARQAIEYGLADKIS